jgi:SAM-dependent methyltransferase
VTPAACRAALVTAAAEPYRATGRFAWHFARGKLGGDPVFTMILSLGLIPDGARILDLGSGQGLLASWLLAARRSFEAGAWCEAWPPAPRAASIHGIELKGADVARAVGALGSRATNEQGDIRFADFGRADVVVILDVLHYLDYADQDAVLARVRAALPPGGRLLLRVGDAARGMAFRISTWVDRLVMLARGHGCVRLHCRPLAAWREALSARGFESAPLPASAGTPFANVLLLAEAA